MRGRVPSATDRTAPLTLVLRVEAAPLVLPLGLAERARFAAKGGPSLGTVRCALVSTFHTGNQHPSQAHPGSCRWPCQLCVLNLDPPGSRVLCPHPTSPAWGSRARREPEGWQAAPSRTPVCFMLNLSTLHSWQTCPGNPSFKTILIFI